MNQVAEASLYVHKMERPLNDDFDKFAYLLLPDAFNVFEYQGFPYVIGYDQIKATVMKVNFATEVNVFGPEFWQYTCLREIEGAVLGVKKLGGTDDCSCFRLGMCGPFLGRFCSSGRSICG